MHQYSFNLKSIFYKKGAKNRSCTKFAEYCPVQQNIVRTNLHGAIFCKFRATAIFSSRKKFENRGGAGRELEKIS